MRTFFHNTTKILKNMPDYAGLKVFVYPYIQDHRSQRSVLLVAVVGAVKRHEPVVQQSQQLEEFSCHRVLVTLLCYTRRNVWSPSVVNGDQKGNFSQIVLGTPQQLLKCKKRPSGKSS